MPILSRRFRFSLVCLLLLLVVVAVAIGAYFALQNDSELADVPSIFGGEEGMAILANPDKVEAYRLGKPTGPHHSIDLKDYPTISPPVAISTADLETLQRLFTDRSSFRHYYKACIPTYGVRLDYVRGNKELQVLFCFECESLDCWLEGQLVGGADFDPVTDQLLRIVKSIFPNDPGIQTLQP
jgi:hypothetical protein